MPHLSSRAAKARGTTSLCLGDAGETEPFSLEQPGLFACYQAGALGIAVSGERTGQPVLRVAFGGASSEPASKDHGGKTEEQPVAEALGVSVYAKQRVHGHDRAQLERLCRYVMRPPLSKSASSVASTAVSS